MKIYVTRYALTKGIIEIDAEYVKGSYWGKLSKEHFADLYRPSEAFEGFSDAQKAAESMRKKKIASIKKQLAKLEKMEFSESRNLDE